MDRDDRSDLRVLVVDDDEESVRFCRDVLLDAGHAPVILPSIAACRGRLETVRPDVILLNLYYYFPGANGLDFLRQRPAEIADVPIIAVSAFGTESQVRHSIALGALDFVEKPFTADLLKQIVRYGGIQIREDRSDGARPRRDRRRSPRPEAPLAVHVESDRGAWSGTSLGMGTFGIKVSPSVAAVPGEVVRLGVSLPNEDASMRLLAVTARTDPDGCVFRFVGFTGALFQRVKWIVNGLAACCEAAGASRPGLAWAGASSESLPLT